MGKKAKDNRIIVVQSKTYIELKELVYNNIVYYKDRFNNIWNNNAELIGIYEPGKDKCHIFHEARNLYNLEQK